MSKLICIGILTAILPLVMLMYIQPPNIPVQQDEYLIYAKRPQPNHGSSVHARITTIVTAYYPLGNAAKHTLADYDSWMSNFFPCVEAPIVVFLPAGPMVEKVKVLRGELPLTLKIMDLWDTEPSMRFRQDFEGNQYTVDPEKHIHSPALYAVWASKSWMLKRAADENPYNSTYFLWVDTGAWRMRKFPSWPDAQKLNELYSLPTHSSHMLLGSAKLIDDHPDFEAGTLYIQGTFFGGTQSAITWWETEYYRVLEEWVEKKRFAGKDQELMTDISLRYPHRVIVIRSFESSHGDPWFFFQPFLAGKSDLNSAELSDPWMNTSHILESPFLEYK